MREHAQPRRIVGVKRAANRADAALEIAKEPENEFPHLRIVGKLAPDRREAALWMRWRRLAVIFPHGGFIGRGSPELSPRKRSAAVGV